MTANWFSWTIQGEVESPFVYVIFKSIMCPSYAWLEWVLSQSMFVVTILNIKIPVASCLKFNDVRLMRFVVEVAAGAV